LSPVFRATLHALSSCLPRWSLNPNAPRKWTIGRDQAGDRALDTRSIEFDQRMVREIIIIIDTSKGETFANATTNNFFTTSNIVLTKNGFIRIDATKRRETPSASAPGPFLPKGLYATARKKVGSGEISDIFICLCVLSLY
jgi:hypothetical protein